VTERTLTLDALLPPDVARKAETVGVAKANLGFRQMLGLAVLAGAFIALGAVFATSATAGGPGEMAPGLLRVLGGLVFCLGLVLVVVAGAELFTGNNLIVMAWAGRKVSTARLLRNWGIVYVGNFVGSVGTAAIVFLSKQYLSGGGDVGVNALTIANTKTGLEWWQALFLGVLCNALVCLAIWLTMSARTVTDKILAIIFPITAFVAAGFEHSVANMFFIPIGLFIKSGASSDLWAQTGADAADFANVTWANFLVGNLIPVTLGNIIGGSMLVGLVYWFIYLRRLPEDV
jgi:formate transporter